MFKQLLTLLRGKSFEAGQAVVQRNAMAVLDQQLRDSAAAINAAQHALARAMTEEQQETQRLAALAARITGLEDRARAALAGDREDLALLAAEAIAGLEMDRDAAAQGSAVMRAHIARKRGNLSEAERRFAELRRGRRLAALGDVVARAHLNPGALDDAEQTLRDLRTRQEAAEMLNPAPLEDQLAQAGFGPATRPNAASVLARLKPLAIAQAPFQPHPKENEDV
jgi:phage shock protein A